MHTHTPSVYSAPSFIWHQRVFCIAYWCMPGDINELNCDWLCIWCDSIAANPCPAYAIIINKPGQSAVNNNTHSLLHVIDMHILYKKCIIPFNSVQPTTHINSLNNKLLYCKSWNLYCSMAHVSMLSTRYCILFVTHKNIIFFHFSLQLHFFAIVSTSLIYYIYCSWYSLPLVPSWCWEMFS